MAHEQHIKRLIEFFPNGKTWQIKTRATTIEQLNLLNCQLSSHHPRLRLTHRRPEFHCVQFHLECIVDVVLQCNPMWSGDDWLWLWANHIHFAPVNFVSNRWVRFVLFSQLSVSSRAKMKLNCDRAGLGSSLTMIFRMWKREFFHLVALAFKWTTRSHVQRQIEDDTKWLSELKCSHRYIYECELARGIRIRLLSSTIVDMGDCSAMTSWAHTYHTRQRNIYLFIRCIFARASRFENEKKTVISCARARANICLVILFHNLCVMCVCVWPCLCPGIATL